MRRLLRWIFGIKQRYFIVACTFMTDRVSGTCRIPYVDDNYPESEGVIKLAQVLLHLPPGTIGHIDIKEVGYEDFQKYIHNVPRQTTQNQN